MLLASLSEELKGIPTRGISTVLFDIAILNAGIFITGASVRNFVFADLCALRFQMETFCRALLRNMINAARDLFAKRYHKRAFGGELISNIDRRIILRYSSFYIGARKYIITII